MHNKIFQTFIFISSIIIPLCIYIILSQYLKTWIVDDAGISFAYSRSLANGYGLVAQPGAERVEGYSNFLWVLLFTPFFLVNCFDPLITPKIVSVILAGILFYFITKICLRLKKSSIIGLIINSLISINAPFIIWNNSGLENPLYVLLIILLIYISIKYSQGKKFKIAITGAMVAFLISITRPDGILFILLFPIAVLLNGEKLKTMIRPLLIYTGILVALLSSFILFRWFYFHDIVPNTYYAKEVNTVQNINDLLFQKNTFSIKFHSIFLAMGGVDFIYIIYVLSGILGLQVLTLRKKTKFSVILFSALILSFLTYMLLPYDVMGYYRFATPFIVITHICFCFITVGIKDLLPRYKKVIVVLMLIFFGIYAYISFNDHHKRLLVYRKNLDAPFVLVKKFYAEKFNNYADLLNINNGSLLLPDVGATYFYSNLRIYDSAGLCDKTIAKGKYTKNRKLIHDYIFTQIKPTFISLHEGWAEMIRPDEYPGFRKEYIPIYETIYKDYSRQNGIKIYTGDYIRKDVITEQNQSVLQDIIKERNGSS